VNPSAELDTETLTEIAGLTGGIYQRARSTQELASIYLALDELEPIEVDQETYRPEKSLFFWPLGSAIILSLFVAGGWLIKTTFAERAFSPKDDAEVTS
jgi:Ca-activated chloride channel family protein